MQGPLGLDWSWDVVTAKPEGTAPTAELEVMVGRTPKGGQTRWKRAKWSRQGGTRPPGRGGVGMASASVGLGAGG